MDSEDYPCDYNDVDSLDDDGCYLEESDIEFEDAESYQPQPPRGNHAIIINEEDIPSRQEQDITEVSDALSVSRSFAIIMLLHNHWGVDDAKYEWFANAERVRKKLGLQEKKTDNDQENRKAKVACGICFHDYYSDEMYDAGCGHLFCESCWKGYINTSVNDGPGCLRLRCPDPPCNAAICQDMVYKFVSDEGKKRYSDYLVRSYIEDNRNIKRCPGPGCGSAIQFVRETESYDVTCECTYSFCWHCTEEAHHPVACSTVEKWTNEGERRKMAKQSIAKYTRYYEKWAGHHSSRAKAVEDLKKVQSVHIEKLSSMGYGTKEDLEFIADAWKQIIGCRRVLKWTYAYGYYLPEYEKTKKRYFEYLQGEAEQGLERLHGCAEKELQPFLDGISPLKDFHVFRTKIRGLTIVTKDFFENLVLVLENGLSEVDCEMDRAIEDYKREGRKYGFYNSDDEDKARTVRSQ